MIAIICQSAFVTALSLRNAFSLSCLHFLLFLHFCFVQNVRAWLERCAHMNPNKSINLLLFLLLLRTFLTKNQLISQNAINECIPFIFFVFFIEPLSIPITITLLLLRLHFHFQICTLLRSVSHRPSPQSDLGERVRNRKGEGLQ